jgi:D-glycero-beta-D-manno-heptose 1-phosphate adenylyltransferase
MVSTMVVSETELLAAIERERSAGKSIALANGCFDVLHVGHVRYLQGAAAEADRLVVAVNDDPSVARLKGANRPILPAEDRAVVVAAVRGVDYVVVFGEATVERLLRLLTPDVHCKGTDYTIDSVPERAIVASYGGRTAIVGDPKMHSTSDLLARVRLQTGTEGGDDRPTTNDQ